ncbi:hypothetical protein T484DRAFT_1789315 [Baffinella frigidus]|nr:hypothetical protein T484DRAFT_1789315 [Cryptophyta sp. CCMP2293]
MRTDITALVVLVSQCAGVCALGGWGQPADALRPASAESGIASCAGAARVTGGDLKRIGAGIQALRGGGGAVGPRRPREAQIYMDCGDAGAGQTTNERMEGMALEFVRVWSDEVRKKGVQQTKVSDF